MPGNISKRLIAGETPLIMGILNVTPDSFFDGNKYISLKSAIAHAKEMAAAGADIIDIGGESTRPGSEQVSVDVELKRVIPVIKGILSDIDIPISVDTRKSEVAKQALESGASIVNDISALRDDPELVNVVRDYNVPVVLMHMKGTPENMQNDPCYSDVIFEIKRFFEERILWAISRGIKEENIIIDPGIGFGKRLEDNLEIIKRLGEFKDLGRPVLIGPSRKSFIGNVLSKESQDRIWGTAASISIAVCNGASIIRVHDVSEMSQVANITINIMSGRKI